MTDELGLENSRLVEVMVDSGCELLKAFFTANPTSGVISEDEAALVINLDATQSHDPSGNKIQYEWEGCLENEASCGDALGASGKETTMRFESGGTYEITLTVSNESCTNKSDVRVIEVNESPTALMTEVMPLFSNLPITVNLDASDSSDNDGHITKYDWAVDGDSTKKTSGEQATLRFDEKGYYTIILTVTDDMEATNTTKTTIYIDELNQIARNKPQVLAAGVTPIQLDHEDNELDIIAWIRPGTSPIKKVSFQNRGGLELKMTLAGVLPNGDEIYKTTYTYGGSIGDTILDAPWGLKENQFHIIATDKAQLVDKHIFPNLVIGNFPEQDVETQPMTTISYIQKARTAPQVIMAGYSPALMDYGDDELDVFAIVRAGKLPIEKVVLKENDGEFHHMMDFIGKLDNEDKVYKY